MRVTVREAAALLDAPEARVYAWIESGDLPAYRIDDQYRINRSELLEWATGRNLPVAPALFHEAEEDERIPSVAESLERGGIHHDVPGGTRDEVLRSILARLGLDDEGDRETLLQLLLARDAGAVVPVGDGIAIPHVRNPIALAADEPTLTLCLLRQPVDFAAPDGRPVFALFTLVSPTTRVHLQMLAKIAYLLRDAGFRDALQARAAASRLIEIARGVERALGPDVR
ncbi:MAG TPA: PTS sugar transporter subunit IIA [Thermoanaerobaculia bacterium]|nr:PTS sugar transporter subunit IIA [Thermoanaerobaculia bacterium]